jgi:hypothetical protein
MVNSMPSRYSSLRVHVVSWGGKAQEKEPDLIPVRLDIRRYHLYPRIHGRLLIKVNGYDIPNGTHTESLSYPNLYIQGFFQYAVKGMRELYCTLVNRHDMCILGRVSRIER